MDLEDLLEKDKAWCIVARVGDARPADGAFEPGALVYCMPPVRGGAFETVKVVGRHRKTGKLVSEVVPARDLEKWKVEVVSSREVLEQISPPWDSTGISQRVAEGIVAWIQGGPWPALELRQWNRQRAEKIVGEGTGVSRFRSFLSRLFGRG